MSAPPRKALGQHFLAHRPLLAKIAAVTGAGPGDVVLEIGPGRGTLTAALLDRGAAVVAIERDERLHAELQRKFAGSEFVLVPGDALKLDWPGLVAPWTTTGRTWLIAGNIPYNITSPLLNQALTPPLPRSVTFLVQREVADRVVSLPGSKDYGGLSIGIQAVAEPSRAFTVDKRAFTPAPKVDSAVLHLVPRDPPLVPPDRIPEFRRMVASVFSYRRKRMLRALREATGTTAEAAGEVLRAAAIDPDVRPETVAVEGFVRLFQVMSVGRGAWRLGTDA